MDDIAYVSERALQELRAAVSATDHRARKAHLAMADTYSLRLRELQVQKRRSEFQLIEAA